MNLSRITRTIVILTVLLLMSQAMKGGLSIFILSILFAVIGDLFTNIDGHSRWIKPSYIYILLYAGFCYLAKELVPFYLSFLPVTIATITFTCFHGWKCAEKPVLIVINNQYRSLFGSICISMGAMSLFSSISSLDMEIEIILALSFFVGYSAKGNGILFDKHSGDRTNFIITLIACAGLSSHIVSIPETQFNERLEALEPLTELRTIDNKNSPEKFEIDKNGYIKARGIL